MKTLTDKEAADLLHVSLVTLWRMARAGKVPAAKVGKQWLFLEDDLLAWIRGQYVAPPREVRRSRVGVNWSD